MGASQSFIDPSPKIVPFRLLDLPIVVLRRFVKINHNVVNFALCNSKCYQLVREAKLKVDEIRVWQSDLEPSISIYAYKLYYDINKLSERDLTNINSLEKTTFKNHSVWMRSDTSYSDLYSEDTVKTFEIFMDYVTSIINSPVEYWIAIIPNFREYYLRNVVRTNVRKVAICGEIIKNKEESSTREEPIPGDIMEFILDETPPHVVLHIGTPPETGFIYPKKLKKFVHFEMKFPEGDTMETIFVNGIDEEYYSEHDNDEIDER